MYLEGDKWKNWHTRCSDSAIKENKSEEDTKPEVGEYQRSRGVGYDLSGFVVSGERLTRLVKYVLNTDEPLSHLDYREFEPNWIQFKFQKEEFNLELLDKLARANDNIVNEAILRQCMIPKKRQIYNFFDDGKCSPSRLYKAYIKKVIPFNKADIHLKIHLVNSALNCSWIWNGDTDYFIGCYIPEYDDNLIWFARTKYGTWFSM